MDSGQAMPRGEAPYVKETMIDGRLVNTDCIDIGEKTFIVSGRFPVVAQLEDEWFEDVADPALVIETLSRSQFPRSPDIFTFSQRFPYTEPQYHYFYDFDSIAALEVRTYEHWWKKQIRSNTRGHVRKASKKDVRIVECSFSDAFVAGMVEIFNETPVRQGRKFWHYGKGFEQVKLEFSRNLHRERLIGAFHGQELIGFVMLGICDRYASLGQIISKIRHRDKSPNNALLAKAVELCADSHIPALVYANWPEGPLADFKRQNGFEPVYVPRYFVPLTSLGRACLRAGLHRGFKRRIPTRLRNSLKSARSAWNNWRTPP